MLVLPYCKKIATTWLLPNNDGSFTLTDAIKHPSFAPAIPTVLDLATEVSPDLYYK